MNRDPAGETVDLDLYGMCHNNVISSVDRLGLNISIILRPMDENECKEIVNKAWSQDKKIAILVDKMNKHSPPCKVPIVICRCCPEEEYPGAAGWYYNDKVTICHNRRYSGQENLILDTYRHELIHAWNKCNGYGGSTCSESMCDEILAYYYNGECEPSGNPAEGDTSKWDCIIRSAAFSSFLGGFCSSEWEGRKAGWKVLKNCIKDAPKPF